MIPIVAMLVLLAVLAGSFWLLHRRKQRRVMPPRVRAEFWVYTSATDRPDDKALLSRITGRNPHKAGIGPREGKTFSDVRYDIITVRRDRNALLFRPEIFSEVDADIPPDLVDLLEETQTIFIVRFISVSDPVDDPSYLQFVTHAVDSLAEMTDATLVWDVESQRYYTREQLFEELHASADATRFDLQVAVRWAETVSDGRAFTRGMAKMGLPDVQLSSQPHDQKILAKYLVEEAARACWASGALKACEINGFGEEFVVVFEEPLAGSDTHRGWLSEMHAGRKRPIPAAS